MVMGVVSVRGNDIGGIRGTTFGMKHDDASRFRCFNRAEPTLDCDAERLLCSLQRCVVVATGLGEKIGGVGDDVCVRPLATPITRSAQIRVLSVTCAM